MASITKEKNGRKTLQFVGPDKVRRSIRLGKMDLKSANAIKHKVESIVASQISGQPLGHETSTWVSQLNEGLSNKLVSVGLIQNNHSTTLGPFLNEYLNKRKIKETSKTVYGHTIRNLNSFFGKRKKLTDITRADAEDWRDYLLDDQSLSENTTRRRSGFAKQFFSYAVKKRLILENPFSELPAVMQTNKSRYHFIKPAEINKVIAQAPDTQWRAIIALCRYGGLRCPSEVLSLRWEDINWLDSRILIQAPKTEHHVGKATRVIPLFNELRPYLEEAFELAESGSTYVISRYRDSKTNLRTTLTKLIERAGLKVWPKLYQNLRSSRETELINEFPMHVVCEWIGNSPQVAMKHYLQVNSDHFEKALQNPVHSPAQNEKKPVKQGFLQR